MGVMFRLPKFERRFTVFQANRWRLRLSDDSTRKTSEVFTTNILSKYFLALVITHKLVVFQTSEVLACFCSENAFRKRAPFAGSRQMKGVTDKPSEVFPAHAGNHQFPAALT